MPHDHLTVRPYFHSPLAGLVPMIHAKHGGQFHLRGTPSKRLLLALRLEGSRAPRFRRLQWRQLRTQGFWLEYCPEKAGTASYDAGASPWDMARRHTGS